MIIVENQLIGEFYAVENDGDQLHHHHVSRSGEHGAHGDVVKLRGPGSQSPLALACRLLFRMERDHTGTDSLAIGLVIFSLCEHPNTAWYSNQQRRLGNEVVGFN